MTKEKTCEGVIDSEQMNSTCYFIDYNENTKCFK